MAVRAASGLSESEDVVRAVEEAVGDAAGRLDGPADLVLLFVGAGAHGDLGTALESARNKAPEAPMLGCTGFGVLTEREEVEGGCGAAAIAFAGVRAAPAPLRAGGAPHRREAVLRVLLPGAGAFTSDLLSGLPADLPWVGGVPGGSPGVAWAPWRGEVEGVVAAELSAPSVEVVLGVTQGCRPVTPFCEVTGSSGRTVLEIDGGPALPKLLGAMNDRVRTTALAHGIPLLVAVERPDGGFLVRNLLAADAELGTISVGDLIREGDRIALAVRDASAARDDLGLMLSGLGAKMRGRRPIAGLYFNCVARGSGLYGMPGIDAGFIGGALGGAPLCGFYGNGEVGSVGGRTLPFSYTGVLAVLVGE